MYNIICMCMPELKKCFYAYYTLDDLQLNNRGIDTVVIITLTIHLCYLWMHILANVGSPEMLKTTVLSEVFKTTLEIIANRLYNDL